MTARDRVWKWQSQYAPYVFLLPFAAVFALFLAYPLGRSLYLSLHKTLGPRHLEFVGLANYRFLLRDWLFWWAVANTTAFTLAFLLLQLPLSLGLALLLNRTWLRGRSVYRFAFFSTYLVGQAFVAIIFTMLLDTRRGLVNRSLAVVHVPRIAWLADPNWAMPSVLLAALWLSVGFGMIYFLAALQSVDRDLYDAAHVDGAGPGARFRHVTLPHIRPVFYFLTFAGVLAGFQLFELPYVMYQGAGPGSRAMTVVLYLFITGFDAGDLGYASAIGWTLVVIVSVIVLGLFMLAQGDAMTAARRIVTHLLLLAAAFVTLTPFLWLCCAAFKRPEDIFGSAFLSPAEPLTLDNFRAVLGAHPFVQWLTNSLFLASTHTVLVVTLSAMGGFALAKYRFRGQRLVTGCMAVTMLLPAQVLIPGSYDLVYRLGWIDSYAAILVPGAVSVFGMFLFRQSIAMAVPDELLAAGRVDGCSEFRLFFELVLPIVRPMIGAFTLMSFLASWNSFLWPQVVLQSESKYTLPIGLANLLAVPSSHSPYGVLLAATLLSILPVIVLFFALQRDFIAGISAGAVKG